MTCLQIPAFDALVRRAVLLQVDGADSNDLSIRNLELNAELVSESVATLDMAGHRLLKWTLGGCLNMMCN